MTAIILPTPYPINLFSTFSTEMRKMPRFDADAKPGVMEMRKLPEGYMQGTDGHYYQYFNEKMSFNDAVDYCEKHGKHFFIISFPIE